MGTFISRLIVLVVMGIGVYNWQHRDPNTITEYKNTCNTWYGKIRTKLNI